MVSAGVKKKNVPRNQKIHWRKYTDTKDVDDFLDKIRQEERLGGPFKGKRDEELYTIVTNANNCALTVGPKPLSKKERARLPPKCLEALNPLTKVPDPIVKRNRVRTKEERKSTIRKSIEERKRLNGYISKQSLDARACRAISLHKKKSIPKGPVFEEDLWEPYISNSVKENLKCMRWMYEETKRHNLTNTGAFKVGVPVGITRKKSVVPTIELPHPGTSYNPSLKDHRDLLNIVAEKEIGKQKHEAHIKRVTLDLFNCVTPSQKAKTWMEEMSQGLPQLEDTIGKACINEQKEEENEYKAINPPVNFLKKKTKKQRRKQKLEKEAILKRKEEKIEKKKTADLYKLRFIDSNINNQEIKQKKRLESRRKLEEFNIARTKRLGTRRYEEPDLVFNRGCELKGNLRSVKNEGNVLVDRFYSLQKRNILVPCVKRLGLRRTKLKCFFKASHKLENIEKKK